MDYNNVSNVSKVTKVSKVSKIRSVFNASNISAVILREDIRMNANRVFRITADTMKLPSKHYDCRFVMNMHFLDEIEKSLIKDGHTFSWIKEQSTFVGIYVYPMIKSEYDKLKYVQDCMTLEEYSKDRTELHLKK